MNQPSWMRLNQVIKDVPKSLLVTGDLHYGITDKRVEAVRVAFLRDVQPDLCLDVGDFWDFWSVSQYPKSPEQLRQIEAQLQFEFDDAQPYVNAVCSVAKTFHLIQGNHEHRITRLTHREPGLHGLRALELHRLAELPEKCKVHPYGTRLHCGPLSFEHGDAVPRGVRHPAAWMLSNRKRNVISGHVHYCSQASQTTYDEYGRPELRMAWTQGAGLDFSKQEYQADPNWQHGFTYIEFYRANGSSNAPWRFNVYPIVVVDGKFSFGGRVYDAKKWQ